MGTEEVGGKPRGRGSGGVVKQGEAYGHAEAVSEVASCLTVVKGHHEQGAGGQASR